MGCREHFNQAAAPPSGRRRTRGLRAPGRACDARSRRGWPHVHGHMGMGTGMGMGIGHARVHGVHMHSHVHVQWALCMSCAHARGSHGPTAHVAAFLVACLPAPAGQRRCQHAPQCLQGRRSGRRWGTARCSNPGPSKHAGARAPRSTTPSSLPGSCEDDAAKRRAARPHVRARAVLARQVSRRA